MGSLRTLRSTLLSSGACALAQTVGVALKIAYINVLSLGDLPLYRLYDGVESRAEKFVLHSFTEEIK